MREWRYQIYDLDSGELLLEDSGFECEADAEEQAAMDAKLKGIKNFGIITKQCEYVG